MSSRATEFVTFPNWCRPSMNVLSWTVDTEGWGTTEFMHDFKSLKTDKSFGWQYGQCARRDCEPKWTCVGIVMCFHILKASMRTHTVLNTKPMPSIHIYQWISWIFNQKLQEDGVRSNKKRNNIMQHSSWHVTYLSSCWTFDTIGFEAQCVFH